MRVLYVEDDEEWLDRSLPGIEILFPNLELFVAKDYHKAVQALEEKGPFDFIVSDHYYAGLHDAHPNRFGSGCRDLLNYVKERCPMTPFVVFAKTDTEFSPKLMGKEFEDFDLPGDRIFNKLVMTFEEVIEECMTRFCPSALKVQLRPAQIGKVEFI
jgi:hypothetical protein